MTRGLVPRPRGGLPRAISSLRVKVSPARHAAERRGTIPPILQMASEDAPALHTSISVLGKYFDLPSLKVFCYLCYANRADWEERGKRARPLVQGTKL